MFLSKDLGVAASLGNKQRDLILTPRYIRIQVLENVAEFEVGSK